MGYFLKRTISKTDEHEKDINHIKQTYVTADELKTVKAEMRGDISGLAADVKEIKENTLTKSDYYRMQSETDRKIDKMMDILLEMNKGGRLNGQ